MNVADIAAFLGVTSQRVHQLVPTPDFPSSSDEMWPREWDRAEIEAWAEANCWGTRKWRVRRGVP